MSDKPSTTTDLFPAIGQVAHDTSNNPESADTQSGQADDDDERAVQEIESLCMKCYEQVLYPVLFIPIHNSKSSAST
ncbi:hypothetical protein PHLCEN_2v10382 [Hermanssonia centrifuga]|uniref:Uncharacterized protein n=1 Tax=Hermanssonia centrifuga TaxID=98765 RepID=A0A2R6NN54_9APHY|nr:hypothetical protein PHLCEN_2v10382 [Hermanssonia centrifuga]